MVSSRIKGGGRDWNADRRNFAGVSMRYRSVPWSLAVTLALGGCASVAQQPTTPYDGLTKTSYGPLTPVPPQSCNPQAQAAGAGVAELSRRLTALIAKPFSGISKVDPVIDSEGLAGNFSIPGDPGMPPVAVINRSNDGIVFWHDLDIVPVSETAAAARTFCDRRERQTVWEGSAERCGTPS